MKKNNRKINAAVRQSSKRLDLRRAAVMWVLTLSSLACLDAGAENRDDYCGQALPRGFDPAPERLRSGRYVNPTYGYSVQIPSGLSAFVSVNAPERGVVIPLSQLPRAYLQVDAAYDVFYDIDPAGVHRRDINAIRLHDMLTGDESADASLAREHGARFLMHVKCHDGSDPIVHEEVIAVRRREIYRLDLQTTPDRLAQDRRQLDAMLRSWRWERIR